MVMRQGETSTIGLKRRIKELEEQIRKLKAQLKEK